MRQHIDEARPGRATSTVFAVPLLGVALLASFVPAGCVPEGSGASYEPATQAQPRRRSGPAALSQLSVGHVDVSPDGVTAVISGVRGGARREGDHFNVTISSDGSVEIVDLRSMHVATHVADGAWPGAVLALPSDGAVVAVIDGGLSLFSARGEARVLLPRVDGVAFSKRRDAALTLVEKQGQYRLLTLPAGEERGVFPRPPGVDREVLLLPSAQEPIVVFVRDGFAWLRRLATGVDLKLAAWGEARGDLRTADLDPQARRIALGSSKAGLALLSLGESGVQEQSIPMNAGQVNAVAVSDDARYVAWGGVDAIVRVFDTGTRHLLASFGKHALPILATAFDAAATTLVTASFESTRRWELAREAATADAPPPSGLAAMPVPSTRDPPPPAPAPPPPALPLEAQDASPKQPGPVYRLLRVERSEIVRLTSYPGKLAAVDLDKNRSVVVRAKLQMARAGDAAGNTLYQVGSSDFYLRYDVGGGLETAPCIGLRFGKDQWVLAADGEASLFINLSLQPAELLFLVPNGARRASLVQGSPGGAKVASVPFRLPTDR